MPNTESLDYVKIAGCLGEASYSSFLIMSWCILLASLLLACLMISCCMGFELTAWLELALLLASVLTLERASLGAEGLLDLLASELQVSLLSKPVSSRMTMSQHFWQHSSTKVARRVGDESLHCAARADGLKRQPAHFRGRPELLFDALGTVGTGGGRALLTLLGMFAAVGRVHVVLPVVALWKYGLPLVASGNSVQPAGKGAAACLILQGAALGEGCRQPDRKG